MSDKFSGVREVGKYSSLYEDVIVRHPGSFDCADSLNGWWAISTIDEGIVGYAATEDYAYSMAFILMNERHGSILSPEYVKIHAYDCAVTLRHGELFTAPMAMDGMIIKEDEKQMLEPFDENFLNIVNVVLDTAFSMESFR